MCRSQQVNEITEVTESSDEEYNLKQTFDSCKAVTLITILAQSFFSKKLSERCWKRKTETRNRLWISEKRKIDIGRELKSKDMKSLKALVRIYNQFINMTVDTGKPVYFFNWTTAKQILKSSHKAKPVQAENLSMPAQFVNYNEHPVKIIGPLKVDVRSAGCENHNSAFEITERRTQSILDLDFQNRVRISTTQKPASKERSSFDV